MELSKKLRKSLTILNCVTRSSVSVLSHVQFSMLHIFNTLAHFSIRTRCVSRANKCRQEKTAVFLSSREQYPVHRAGPLMRLDRMRSRQTEAGETRKGLRVDFGAQFNTRRRTVPLVCDFSLDRPNDDLKAAWLNVRLLGRLHRLCFFFLSLSGDSCAAMVHVANVSA